MDDPIDLSLIIEWYKNIHTDAFYKEKMFDYAKSAADIAWNTDHFEVTPPTQAEIQANPQTVAPAGVFELTLRSAAGHTREVELPVRLYGINSSEEFNEFRLAYGNGNASFSGSGVSYARRLDDCADYLVTKGMPFRDAYKITGGLGGMGFPGF